MAEWRKVMVILRKPITKKGLSHWSPKIRRKVFKYTFNSKGSFKIPYTSFETRHKLAEWLHSKLDCGYFYLFIWRKGYYSKKNRLRPYRIAIIEIIKTEAGYTPRFVELRRIAKFSWFEPSSKKNKKRRE